VVECWMVLGACLDAPDYASGVLVEMHLEARVVRRCVVRPLIVLCLQNTAHATDVLLGSLFFHRDVRHVSRSDANMGAFLLYSKRGGGK